MIYKICTKIHNYILKYVHIYKNRKVCYIDTMIETIVTMETNNKTLYMLPNRKKGQLEYL